MTVQGWAMIPALIITALFWYWVYSPIGGVRAGKGQK